MENPHFFISYNHADRDAAMHLENIITKLGISFFMDNQMRYNENFIQRIEKEIKKSTYVMVLFSKKVLNATWVNFEINEAKKNNIPVIPILLERDISLKPFFDENVNYFSFYENQISVNNFINMLIDHGLVGDGLLPIGMIQNYNNYFPNEQIAVELLANDVKLRKNTNDEFEIVINRNNVKNAAISNRGKNNLCSKYVNPKRADLIEKDIIYHEFLMGKDKKNEYIIIPTENIPLRWCSGGILSIVKFKEKWWVPLFFRDIKPDGWNLSLGASERRRHDLNENWETELSDPWKLIIREFLEETLILSKKPKCCDDFQVRQFVFENMDAQESIRMASEFAQDHKNLRQQCDHLSLNDAGKPIYVRLKTGFDMNLIIEKDGIKNTLHDVIISINLLELGIEIIKVIEFKIGNEDYMLDGEILEDEGTEELVRMPFALLSFSYLRDTFGGEDFQLQYTDDIKQPSIIGKPFKNENDIYLFDWDIDRRMQIHESRNYRGIEEKRYTTWAENYDSMFRNLHTIPSRFTPATAKALNLFFKTPLSNLYK